MLGAATCWPKPNVPQNFGTSHMLAHSMSNSNQIWHDDQGIIEENCIGSTTPHVPGPKFLVTRMLTRDLFAVETLFKQFVTLRYKVAYS